MCTFWQLPRIAPAANTCNLPKCFSGTTPFLLQCAVLLCLIESDRTITSSITVHLQLLGLCVRMMKWQLSRCCKMLKVKSHLFAALFTFALGKCNWRPNMKRLVKIHCTFIVKIPDVHLLHLYLHSFLLFQPLLRYGCIVLCWLLSALPVANSWWMEGPLLVQMTARGDLFISFQDCYWLCVCLCVCVPASDFLISWLTETNDPDVSPEFWGVSTSLDLVHPPQGETGDHSFSFLDWYNLCYWMHNSYDSYSCPSALFNLSSHTSLKISGITLS